MFTFDYRDVSFSHKDGFSSSPKDEFHKHIHHFYEILYFVCGDVQFHVEDKYQKLSPGDIVLIHPGQFHFADVSRNDVYQRYVCKMPEEEIPEPIREKVAKLGPFYQHCDNFLPVLEDLDHYSEEFTGEDMRALCIARMVELLVRLTQKEATPLQAEKDSVARDLVSYIEEHINERITLETLASAFHYSTSYIATSFRKEMHVSIISYVRGKKVMAAHALILHGVKPSEAAAAMGFTDYSTFFRSYQKMLGVPPSTARKTLLTIPSIEID